MKAPKAEGSWSMATSPRTSNTGLASLLGQAKWSQTQFARAVNRIGAEAGLTLRYDPSAVSHWLSGTTPRAEVRPVVLEALARRLKRPVTHAEAGFPGPVAGNEGSDLEDLIDAGRADMDPSRRGVLTAGVYSAALAVPLFPDLAGRAGRAATGRTVRIGESDVTTVSTMTEKIADILDELGGGHARPM